MDLLLNNAKKKNDCDTNENDIFEAVSNGDEYSVKSFIDNGCDLNEPKNGITLLHHAVLRNRTDMVCMLLENGANPNIRNHDGNTPLHLAILDNRTDLANILIKSSGCDFTSKNNETASLLQLLQIKSQRYTQWREIKTIFEIKTATNFIDQSTQNDKPNSSQKRILQDEDEEASKKVKTPIRTNDSTYASSGLKTSLHGTIYQLQLLMLFAHRARKHNFACFDLATELDAAEKFDDVVIKYKKSPQENFWTWRFLQAKHKHDVNDHRITVNDLTTKDKNGDFSLQKYFLSFCKIKVNPEFRNDTLEEFDLCTNTDFDFRESGKHKIDGTLTLVALRQNEAVNKWKNYFEDIDMKHDKVLYFEDDIKRVKTRFKVGAQDELLKFMKVTFLEKNFDTKNLTEINKYLQTVKRLESKLMIREKIDEVNKILNINKVNKTLLEKLSNLILKLKGTILENENYKLLEKFTKKDKTTTKPPLNKVYDELNTITNEIDKVLKDDEEKMNEYLTTTSQAATQLNKERAQFENDQKVIKLFLEDLPNLLTTTDVSLQLDNANLTHMISKNLLNMFKTPNADLDAAKTALREELQTYITKTIILILLLDDQTFQNYMREFIEKFRIITNYPNVDTLNEYLCRALGENFKLLNADLVTDSFQKEILDWLKQYNKGRSDYLSNNKDDAFFNSINEKIRTLMASGLCKAYPEKLKSYGMRFNENIISLTEFLQSTNKKCLHLCTNSTRLAAIHVLEILEKCDTFTAHDSYVFLRDTTILRKQIQDLLLESFNSKRSHNLLVIEIKPAIQHNLLKKLFRKLKYAIENAANDRKRIIIISNKENLLDDSFGQTAYYDIKTLQIAFKNLDKDSQNQVLEKVCMFQNKQVKLNKLMNHKTAQNIFNKDTLTDVIEGKIIEIGNDDTFYFNDCIQEYYVERNMHRQNIKPSVFVEINTELFFVTGIDGTRLIEFQIVADFVYKYDKDGTYGNGIVWCDSDEVEHRTIYLKLCSGSGKKNVHWLDYHNDNFYWERSNGDFKTIFMHIDRYYICTDNYFHEDYFSIPTKVNEKLVIIANDTGVGKSTFLTQLSRKMVKKSDYLWAIRINLNDFAFNKDKLPDKDSRHKMKSLKEISFAENDIACAIDYVTEMATTDDSVNDTFQKRLLKFSLQVTRKEFFTPQIVLLFDGFDEICPTYTNQTITLLKALKQTNAAQIYITTRLHEKELIESALQTPAFVLKPLEKDEQIGFLSKFWRYSLKFFKEENNQKLYTKIHEYLTETKSILDATEISEIIDNISIAPLQTNEKLREYIDHIHFSKFADAVLSQWKNKIIDNDTTFNIVPLHLRMLAEIVFYDKFKFVNEFKLLDLYNRFIEIKYSIFYDEKKNLGNTVGSEEIRERDSRGLRKIFYKISCQVLFPDIYTDTFDESAKVQFARIGLLILKGTRLDFIHRSFAGFFLSEFIVVHFSEEQTQTILFQTILFEEGYNFVREFFDCQLECNFLEDEHLSKNSAEQIKIIYGRDTILHIAVHEGYTTTAQFIIEKLIKHPQILQEMLLITGKYGAVFDEIVHNPIRNTKVRPKMLKILLKKLDGHYDILEKVLTRLAETNGLILVERQTSFTILEKLIACKNLDLIEAVLDSVKDNPETLRKILLTNRVGLLNFSCRCWSKSTEHFPRFLNILYETITDRSLFEELLLEKDEDQYTVLHLLAYRRSNPLFIPLLTWLKQLEMKYEGIVGNLLEAKGKLNLTALEIAVYQEHTTITALLEFIKESFGTIFQDIASPTPEKNILYKAIVQGRENSSILLLNWFRRNVDSIILKNLLLTVSRDGRNCLHLASARNFHITVEAFLNFLKDINNTMTFGNILKEMLTTTQEEGRTALTEALRWKSDLAVDVLLKFMSFNVEKEVVEEVINKRNKYEQTIIHITAESGSPEGLKILLQFILDQFGKNFLEQLILSGDNYGNTASHQKSTVLLDFVHQNLNIIALKKMVLKANRAGTTLVDILMYPETEKMLVVNAEEKLELILTDTSTNLTLTNLELSKLKNFIIKYSQRSDKANILQIIDSKLQNFSTENAASNNEENQPSTSGSITLCLPL